MNSPEATQKIRLSRHYLGQAALNMLIYPDDTARIDRNIDRASEFARQYHELPDHERNPEDWQRLIAEGKAIRCHRANLDRLTTYLFGESSAESQSLRPAGEEPTDPVLRWLPTDDGLGAIAQHRETVYTVHAAGNPRGWRFGIGDGTTTGWFDERFANEEQAREAAQQHLDQQLADEATVARTELDRPAPHQDEAF